MGPHGILSIGEPGLVVVRACSVEKERVATTRSALVSVNCVSVYLSLRSA